MSHFRLIVFARYPSPGRVKTHLIPALGTHGSALLQHRMTSRTLTVACKLVRDKGLGVDLQSADDVEQMRELYPGPWEVTPQSAGTLGERLQSAIAAAFAGDDGPVVVIGSDCPALTTADLSTAFDYLADHDVVLGPATAGRYYLIGLRKTAPALFDGIDWSTDRVLAQTLNAARRHGLCVHQLRALPVVDRPEDLAQIPVDLLPHRSPISGISVVIPVLNEESTIDGTLTAMEATEGISEIIVVDGGSTDNTVARAGRHASARVLSSASGCGLQMHAGALAATGDAVWFLYANTLSPRDAQLHIAAALANPTTVGGNFEIRFDGQSRAARFLTWLYQHLSRFGQRYGDSGYFVRRTEYLAVGGFRPYPLFEDLDLMGRLLKRGRFVRVPAVVTTSPRRLEGRTFAFVLARWATLQVLYWLGVPPTVLGRFGNHIRLRSVGPAGDAPEKNASHEPLAVP